MVAFEAQVGGGDGVGEGTTVCTCDGFGEGNRGLREGKDDGDKDGFIDEVG